MKSLRTCFAGLVALLLLVGCAQAVSQPASTPQDTIVAPMATGVTEPTGTPTETLTPLPLATHRPTSVESPSLTPATTIPPMASLTLVPTSRFTRTASPTITPTNTRFVMPPIGGLTWTPVIVPYKCNVLTIYPPYGQITTKPRGDFTALWRVYNTGANMWHVGDIVFGYVKGQKMQNPDRGDTILPFTIYKGDKINLQMHLTPPKEPGIYTIVLGFRKTNKKDFFCTWDVTVTVVHK